MKRICALFIFLMTYAAFGKTVSNVAISPQGAVLQAGSKQQFTAACTYSDASSDDCTAAGGATWTSSRLTAMTVTSSGLATWTTDPGVSGYSGGFVVVSAGGATDKASVTGQHPGDVWTTFVTPAPNNFQANFSSKAPALNVVVGSTVALGYGFQINGNGNNPLQGSCSWSSSNPAVATIDRIAHVTAVSPGSVDLICNRSGDAVYGTSSANSWVAPGNIITLSVVNGGSSNQTWYIRPGGGLPYTNASDTPNGQCDGLHDADYSGTGINQPCALGNLRYLWSTEVGYGTLGWTIAGGDTIIVRQNTNGYNVGGDANGLPGNCHGNQYDCYMPSIPSGSASRHTRLLGENFASCSSDSAKTKLRVTFSAYAGLNLKDSQFVDVSCFDVSDRAAFAGGNFSVPPPCPGGSVDCGGALGVLQSALTASVTYTDVLIHGLSAAVHGATGVGVVMNRLHARGNMMAGIDMDDGPFNLNNISVSGGLTLTNSIIEFSGCIEEYPIVHQYPYIECRDQSTGGYGDGLGTASTSGDWIFDHDTFYANFQDGLDLLHSGMHTLSITNSKSIANDGQSYKIGSGDNVIFRNNLALVNCARILHPFGDEPASAIVPGVSPCRAGQDGVVFAFTDMGTYQVQNNTFSGYNATMFDIGCEGGWEYCQNAVSTFQNNIVIGYSSNLDGNDGRLPGLFYLGNASMPANSGWAVRDHNFFYNVRYCPTPLQTGETCNAASPGLTALPASPITSPTSLDTFSALPLASSPLIGAGIALSSVLTDSTGALRPKPPAIGAMEYAPATALSVAQVTVTASPSATSVGQVVTLTAAIAPVGSTTPSGTVTFLNGSNVIGTATANASGVATLTTSTLAAGTYTVSASYPGDTNYQAGVSGTTSLTLSPVQSGSAVSVVVSPTAVTAGQTATFRASIATVGGVVPTGTVTFRSGSTSLGTGTLSAGVATLTNSTLAGGTYAISASYAGDSNYVAGVSAASSLVVTASLSTAAVSVSVTPASTTTGQAVTMTASVATVGGVVPTGTVTFRNGGTTLGTAVLNTSGIATFKTSSLAAATYSVAASYGGDTKYLTGTSAATSLVIKAPLSAAVVNLTATPTTISATQTVTLKATVATVGSVVPTGTISFLNGGTLLGTANLNGAGVASLTNSTLAAGTYSISASYAGDTQYATGASAAISLKVGASIAVSLTVGQPEFGFNVIPGSTRRIFANVVNGATNQILWTMKTGSGTLSSTSGSWVDVVAPATGSACSYSSKAGVYSVTSSTTFTVEATSVDDSTKLADLTFNVCSPTVQVAVVPFYRTVYANQSADLQSLVTGSVNQNVQWAISSQPIGGDGKLGDTTSHDTVFAASVAGRYTLTSTSQADSSKTSNAIVYVTGHAIPYTNPVTPNYTTPVDCSIDPSMAGTVYEVGPSQAFHALANVPFPSMPAGSSVRLHNEDTTGLHPTEYHEYVQIMQKATALQPTRICGVPDNVGNLPIVDGSGATGRSDVSSAIAGMGLLTIHSDSATGAWPSFSSPGYVVVEGIHFRNAKTGNSYKTPGGSSASWGDTSACVRINQGQNTAFIGNDFDNCGTGAMSAWNATGGWGAANLNVLWEGNHLHNNGIAGSTAGNQMDLQAWGEVVQFNRIDTPTAGTLGANIKSRGLQGVIRYNYLGDGPDRQMDLVDVKAGAPYMSFSGYLSGGNTSYKATHTSETYPADQLAAEQEAWNTHYVYGNIYQNSVSATPIHFATDTAGAELSRKGSMYWYNNTFYQMSCAKCGALWTLFDTSAGKGTFLSQTEFPTVQSFNNIVWMDTTSKPAFQWNNYSAFIGVSGKNLMPTAWGTNDTTGAGTGSGWNIASTTDAYQNSTNLAAHITGFTNTNLITTSTIPFDPTSWVLSADVAGNASVPSAVCQMPARFAYLPNLGFAVARISTPNVGATDTSAEMGTQMTSIRGVSRFNTHYSNCR
jgi:hypothetical protein